MRFGFFGVNAGVLSEPATMVAAATTAEAAGGILRHPGVGRDLLQKSAEVFQAAQPNRLSWTIVPISMRDRRGEHFSGSR